MGTGDKKKAAASAEGEELWKLIRDRHPDVLLEATLNRNLSEDMAVLIAKNVSTPPEALEFLSGDKRFKGSYKLKLALCRNPRTPQRVTFSLLKFLRIFDVSDLTKDQHIPTNVRQKMEQFLSDKIPSLPSGIKTAIARRVNASIVSVLIGTGDEHVVDACLENPLLTEGILSAIINRPTTKAAAIRAIAANPKWSLRYTVRYALVRNFHTPMVYVDQFIRELKSADLKDLYADPKLPASTRPFIFRELLERGETTEEKRARTYKLDEEE